MDDLVDPLGDRVMKNVPCIARFPLTREQLWDKTSKNNRDSFKTWSEVLTHRTEDGDVFS